MGFLYYFVLLLLGQNIFFITTSHADTAPPVMDSPLRGPLLTESKSYQEIPASRPSPGPGVQVSLGPGIVVYSGKYSARAGTGVFGVSMNGGMVVKPFHDISLFVGADMGIDSWDFSSTDNVTSYHVIGVQGLPTAYYRFDSIGEKLYPYLGFSVGPYFYYARTGNNGSSASELDLYFEFLVRPGITIQVAPNFSFNFEPKFGVLHSSAIFLPMAGANLSL
jgi:hypothetical protein